MRGAYTRKVANIILKSMGILMEVLHENNGEPLKQGATLSLKRHLVQLAAESLTAIPFSRNLHEQSM